MYNKELCNYLGHRKYPSVNYEFNEIMCKDWDFFVSFRTEILMETEQIFDVRQEFLFSWPCCI